MAKKKQKLIYLTDERNDFVKEQASNKGESMSTFISSLIDKEQKRVERIKG
tara:strand:+ start:181 stop:333 length:153 start_codon:yes stop_codon:yes gene_type:complete